jgi:hypothetical protein
MQKRTEKNDGKIKEEQSTVAGMEVWEEQTEMCVWPRPFPSPWTMGSPLVAVLAI